MKEFVSGNVAAFKGAIAAGARAMFGYPITPSTEILQSWSEAADKNDHLVFLQTEDETAAGFCLNGAVLQGVKSFTATAGPGTVLMQDGLSMAENLRLPTVTIVMQRGGPSTGTVNYSQQETLLTCFGGNGEGLRIVYSAGTPQEMYDFTIKAFDSAWRYRFPTILLGDGYIGKQMSLVDLKAPLNPIKSENLLSGKNIRNCYSSEDEFADYLKQNILAFEKAAPRISEFHVFGKNSAENLIVAHGSTYFTVKEAIESIDPQGKHYQIFRPITLRPFPGDDLNRHLKNKRQLWFFESSYGQMQMIAKSEIDFSQFRGKIQTDFRPAKSFLIEDIIETIRG